MNNFEEYLMNKVDCKDVAVFENYLEQLDIEEWLKLGTEYAIKEKGDVVKRIDDGFKKLYGEEI